MVLCVYCDRVIASLVATCNLYCFLAQKQNQIYKYLSTVLFANFLAISDYDQHWIATHFQWNGTGVGPNCID